jgi:hypothetical protein
MAEVILKWELERIKNENADGQPEEKRLKLSSPSPSHTKGVVALVASDSNKPLDPTHVDVVLSFLLRIACQVHYYKKIWNPYLLKKLQKN